MAGSRYRGSRGWADRYTVAVYAERIHLQNFELFPARWKLCEAASTSMASANQADAVGIGLQKADVGMAVDSETR